MILSVVGQMDELDELGMDMELGAPEPETDGKESWSVQIAYKAVNNTEFFAYKPVNNMESLPRVLIM